MFFPWLGFIQLVAGAETYVRLDNVKFSKGSFTNRVQIKTNNGKTWITLPVGMQDDRTIDQVVLLEPERTFKRIRSQIIENYRTSRFVDDVVGLVDAVLDKQETVLSDISYRSTLVLLEYFGIRDRLNMLDVRDLRVTGAGSDRVLSICRLLGANTYLSAAGGVNYLAHSDFEAEGITVKYPMYDLTRWEQLGEDFDPYVSALDVVANCGSNAQDMIHIEFESWRNRIESAT